MCIRDRASSDPAAMREAKVHLLAAQEALMARKKARPTDPYVAALEGGVENELICVQAQLRSPDR